MSSRQIESILYWIVRIGTYLLPFTLLVVSGSLFFPYITAKNFFFRIIVECMGAAWGGLLLIGGKTYMPRRTLVVVAFSALLIISFISSIAGVDFGFSFWSNFERMEGLITYLHLFLLFLILAGTFKTKREWFWIFGISLLVSFFLSFYGLLEYMGVVNTFADSTRVISTLGNPLYVAAYLTFHVFLMAFLWGHIRSRMFRWTIAALFLFEILIFFLTGSRGAFLGIIGGSALTFFLWLLFTPGAKKKVIFGVILIVLIATPFLFQAVGDVSFIKNNDVLSRFTSISLSDSTVRARFTIWGMAFDAFLERPLLGWGVGNFIIPFAKFYDVRMFGNEPWFDRTHNMPLEWLVATGIIGFLIYVFVFAAMGIALFRAKQHGVFRTEDAILFIGMLAAYLFQLLFVFDVLATYLMLIFMMAFFSVAASSLHAEWIKTDREVHVQKEFPVQAIVGVAALWVLAVGFIYILNIKPYYAADKLIDGFRLIGEGKNAEALQDFRSARSFSAGTVGVAEVREHVSRIALGVSSNPPLIQNTDINALYQFAIAEMEDQVKGGSEKYPNIRSHIILGRLYGVLGIITNNVSLVGKADEQYNKALSFAPTYLPLHQLYAEFLLQSGNFSKALSTVQHAEILLSKVNKSDSDLVYSKPLIFVAAGDFNGALNSFKEIKSVSGMLERDKVKNIVAVARQRAGAAALPFVEQMYILDESNPFLALTLAELYAQRGEKGKAREFALRAKELDPSVAGEVEEFLKGLQ